ncbi:MAG: sulfotransferase domain-containing protein [Pseudomonadales bacterium]|nr:sulfotransferase domain-containing protein [Pseudomonadales bacterium]
MSETTERSRARSMEEMHHKMGSMFGGQAPTGEAAEPYRPLPTDVIITPFAKCGTTWLQQMFHTLRTRGDCDYDDISRVVPWIEMSPLLGIPLNAPQRGLPRGFKSHLSYTDVPKGARYIVAMRDPRDALVSMYRFMEGWFMEPGAIDIGTFARADFMNPESRAYWRHLASWWDQREEENVLMLSYEGMKADQEATIRRVARFAGIELDDELLAITLENSSLAFMQANKDKFDDLMMREMSEKNAGLPPGSESSKVRDGKTGSHVDVLGPELLAELDAIWQEEIAAKYGFADYAAMEKALRDSMAGA